MDLRRTAIVATVLNLYSGLNTFYYILFWVDCVYDLQIIWSWILVRTLLVSLCAEGKCPLSHWRELLPICPSHGPRISAKAILFFFLAVRLNNLEENQQLKLRRGTPEVKEGV